MPQLETGYCTVRSSSRVAARIRSSIAVNVDETFSAVNVTVLPATASS